MTLCASGEERSLTDADFCSQCLRVKRNKQHWLCHTGCHHCFLVFLGYSDVAQSLGLKVIVPGFCAVLPTRSEFLSGIPSAFRRDIQTLRRWPAICRRIFRRVSLFLVGPCSPALARLAPPGPHFPLIAPKGDVLTAVQGLQINGCP